MIDIFKLMFGFELDIIINQKKTSLSIENKESIEITGEMNINHGELAWKQQD